MRLARKCAGGTRSLPQNKPRLPDVHSACKHFRPDRILNGRIVRYPGLGRIPARIVLDIVASVESALAFQETDTSIATKHGAATLDLTRRCVYHSGPRS